MLFSSSFQSYEPHQPVAYYCSQSDAFQLSFAQAEWLEQQFVMTDSKSFAFLWLNFRIVWHEPHEDFHFCFLFPHKPHGFHWFYFHISISKEFPDWKIAQPHGNLAVVSLFLLQDSLLCQLTLLNPWRFSHFFLHWFGVIHQVIIGCIRLHSAAMIYVLHRDR